MYIYGVNRVELMRVGDLSSDDKLSGPQSVAGRCPIADLYHPTTGLRHGMKALLGTPKVPRLPEEWPCQYESGKSIYHIKRAGKSGMCDISLSLSTLTSIQ